ncbi:MAG: Crp/Fnr family transcriptional regulator [Haliscomenobacteraceae bacterium CHB4]|nr:CRP-like cAMP-activated global transcriptional regulator [Saprospiraceae bacterium]MCE7922108.1 Crp/Fnr family transcriptional regulator [Haliscomenobacteraceae bacterium CHB4]
MDMNTKLQLLGKLPVLSALSTGELEQLAAIATFRRAPKFQFIFMPDETADHLYILGKGRVKTGTFSSDGREVIKEILQPEMMFGDLALAGETKRSEFAQALHDEVEYLAIKVDDFQHLMQQNQRLVFACLQHLTQRLQRVEERLAKLVLKDARERIIEFLVETAGKEGRRVGYETLLKHHLTQQDIANLTGTSRQTVTSVLNDLRKSNLIYFNRNSILIRDIEKLA